jgi:hypothetical protein
MSCSIPILPNMTDNAPPVDGVNQMGNSNGSVPISLCIGDAITLMMPNGNFMATNSNHDCNRVYSVSEEDMIGNSTSEILVLTVVSAATPYDSIGTPVVVRAANQNDELMSTPVYLIAQKTYNPQLWSVCGDEDDASACSYYYLNWDTYTTDLNNGFLGLWPGDYVDNTAGNWQDKATWYLVNYDASSTSTVLQYGDQISLVSAYASSTQDYFSVYDCISAGSGCPQYGDFSNCDAYNCTQEPASAFLLMNASGFAPLNQTQEQACPNGITCTGCVAGSTTQCANGCAIPQPDLGSCTVACPDSCSAEQGDCTSKQPITIANCTPSASCGPAVAGHNQPTDAAVCINGGTPTCSSDGKYYVCAIPPTTSKTLYIILAAAGLVVVALILAFVFSFKKTFKSGK